VAVYADRSDYAVNQGDIFKAVPFPVPALDGSSLDGMVISNDCDCDKFLDPKTPLTDEARAAWRVTVAWVQPIEALPPARRKLVRDDRMPRYMHLPAEDEHPERVVDLWLEQPVLMLDLMNCDRLASLSPEARNALWWKIIRLRLGQHYKNILRGEIPPDAA
jgi:hypothetical protein